MADLPEPVFHARWHARDRCYYLCDKENSEIALFTADQLTDHAARVRAEAMEEAAEMCEGQIGIFSSSEKAILRGAAAAIRSLIDLGSEGANHG